MDEVDNEANEAHADGAAAMTKRTATWSC